MLRDGAGFYGGAIYFMLAYVYVLPVLVLILAFSVSSLDELGLMFFLGFGLHFFLIGIAGAIAHKRMRAFDNFSKSKRITSLNPDQIPSIYPLLHALLKEFRMEERKVTLWKSVDLGQTPSVVEFRGEVQLLIPIGTIALASVEPDVVKAMLAHELTHVMVGDTHLWTMSEPFARQILKWTGIPAIISVLLSGLGIVLEYGLWPGNWPSITTGWFMPFMFYRGCLGIMELRRRSEVFADITAAIVTSPEAMIRAIKICIKDDRIKSLNQNEDPSRPTWSHPAKLYRIARLETLIKGGSPFPANLQYYQPSPEK